MFIIWHLQQWTVNKIWCKLIYVCDELNYAFRFAICIWCLGLLQVEAHHHAPPRPLLTQKILPLYQYVLKSNFLLFSSQFSCPLLLVDLETWVNDGRVKTQWDVWIGVLLLWNKDFCLLSFLFFFLLDFAPAGIFLNYVLFIYFIEV